MSFQHSPSSSSFPREFCHRPRHAISATLEPGTRSWGVLQSGAGTRSLGGLQTGTGTRSLGHTAIRNGTTQFGAYCNQERNHAVWADFNQEREHAVWADCNDRTNLILELRKRKQQLFFSSATLELWDWNDSIYACLLICLRAIRWSWHNQLLNVA